MYIICRNTHFYILKSVHIYCLGKTYLLREKVLPLSQHPVLDEMILDGSLSWKL